MVVEGPGPGIVSLVIAITGHRDLFQEDEAELQTAIEDTLRAQQQKYRATPLLLLSALAEGADRIAVRAAKALGIRFSAVLPMKQEIYRSDFNTMESLDEFEALLAEANEVIVLPNVNGAADAALSAKGKARDRQYGCLGEFLASASQIMIAVWDRTRSGLAGGTSEVVARKLGEKQQYGGMGFVGVNASGAGPVYVLLTRRVSTGPAIPTGMRLATEYPEGTKASDYEAIYQALNQYNADVCASRELEERASQSREYLCEGQQASGATAAMEWVAEIYSWADTMAIRYAQGGLWLWKLVFVLLALGGTALACLHTIAPLEGKASIRAVYYLSLLAALALGTWEMRGKRRTRHEDYRALAEALRVQFFWMASGLPDLAYEKYLRNQVGEMLWIRDAMSECCLYTPKMPDSGRKSQNSRLSLAITWIGSQVEYFRQTTNKHHRKQKICSTVAYVLLGVGFVMPLVGWLMPISPSANGEAAFRSVPTISMVWAALVWNYAELRGYTQEGRQYRRMYKLFSSAHALLTRCNRVGTAASFAEAENIIRQLGQDALAENGDWFALHRERKLSPELALG